MHLQFSDNTHYGRDIGYVSTILWEIHYGRDIGYVSTILW